MTMNSPQTFFVTDVETSGVDPMEDVIFTLGCVAVTYDGQCATIEGNYFYEAIDQEEWINTTRWLHTIMEPQSTLSWWLRQPIDVQKAAWREPKTRLCYKEVGSLFCDFVAGMTAHLTTRPIFAASPASFDLPFVDRLLRDSGEKNPFDYRTLCIRSMAYGQQRGESWGINGWQNRSQASHHALYDAYGAAQDLVDLLTGRDDSAYEDQLNLKYTGSSDE